MAEHGDADDAQTVAFADLADLTGRFARGGFTPLQALDLHLARIDRLNPRLNAFLHLDQAGARRDAQASTARWAAGRPLSPVDGALIGVKANIAVRGLPWHAGIGAYRDRVAGDDADGVATLRKAGAVILGVLNMHEAALGATTDNIVFGRCHNPRRHGFTPGGSSGGSAAAVAAGLCSAALGTDTMGSVRIPASYCGVVGHMAGRGRISLHGVVPLSWTLDALGVLTRSARDAKAMLSVLAGTEPVRPTIAPTGLTCGVIDLSGQAEVDDDVGAAFETLLSSAGAKGIAVRPVRLGRYDVAAMRRLCLLVAEVEALVVHEAKLASDPDGFSPQLRGMLAWAGSQPAAKLASAYRRLALTAAELAQAWAGVDALLTPTTGSPAFAFDTAAPAGQSDFTLLANIAGLAATAFPMGLSREGLPLSAQVMSASDATALALATALTAAVVPPNHG